MSKRALEIQIGQEPESSCCGGSVDDRWMCSKCGEHCGKYCFICEKEFWTEEEHICIKLDKE